MAASSVLASHHRCCDPRDMLGHCCLTVLTATASIAALLILMAPWCRPRELGHLPAGVWAVATRAPPTGPARLTQFFVLRRGPPLIY